MTDYGNPQVEGLPARLRRFVVDQHYEKYTSIDQAVWRYVMRQNWYYLKDAAYYPYISGLKRAGLSIEYIPRLQTMNDSLQAIGWGAVTVDGFIPPAAFMEFQSYRVLVIASDIRQLQHIEYTPAPDIIHESAGHAPIIADQAYAAYLSYFGQIGSKALFSKADFELYESVRRLSILKEMPDAPAAELPQMEAEVKYRQDNLGTPSEMALLSRLHWWTVEYGLIGSLTDSKIYGAGLLSSIGESVNCMKDHVKKLPYTIEALNYPFDITTEQPQLFVTPNFQNLMQVLDSFADTMAFRVGGTAGMKKAQENGNTCTLMLDTGLQLTAILKSFLHVEKELSWISLGSPCALALYSVEIPGFGRLRLPDGLAFPFGPFKSSITMDSLEDGDYCKLVFAQGAWVAGHVQSVFRDKNTPLFVVFDRAEICAGNKEGEPADMYTLNNYVLPLGSSVSSVFNGAADKDAFEDLPPMAESTASHQPCSPEQKEYQRAYATVRSIREAKLLTVAQAETLEKLWNGIQHALCDTWLCGLEILELLAPAGEHSIVKEIEQKLQDFAEENPGYRKLISDGIRLLSVVPGEATDHNLKA